MKRGEELVLSKNKFIEKTKEKIKYKNKKLEEEGAGDERRELYKCDKKKQEICLVRQKSLLLNCHSVHATHHWRELFC